MAITVPDLTELPPLTVTSPLRRQPETSTSRPDPSPPLSPLKPAKPKSPSNAGSAPASGPTAGTSDTLGASALDQLLPPDTQTVLLVDDEPSVVNALRRLLRKERCRVLTAHSGAQALELFELYEISAVISDYRMPGMTGAELLEQVRECSPDTIRILLTGQADIEAVMEAVNRGSIFKFMMKPWKNELLVDNLREALRLNRLVEDNRALSKELYRANQELRELNQKLEQRVEDKARELIRVANFDALTGLPNRRLMADRLDHSIRASERKGQKSALLVFGVDRFKLVNESLGHAGGDQLLCAIARRFGRVTTDTGSIARVAGDEFAFVLAGLEDVEDIVPCAKRILGTLSDPFEVRGREIFLTGSLGISVYPSDGDTVTELFNAASSALNFVKRSGGGSYKYYSQALNENAEKRLLMEANLRRALDNNEFRLHFQPRVESATGRLIGAEALIRWDDPARGSIPPSVFVPLLEETDLIQAVGTWVFEEACRAAKRWRENTGRELTVSINLSPRQLAHPDLVETLEGVMQRVGIDPKRESIELEITESLLIEDESQTHKTLGALHDLGITIAIDDFGTGYSALNYLTRFPIDVLKVDRSFITRVTQDEDSESLVRAIISMAHSLRLRVVAEGVETEAQWEFLRGLDCEEIQGYLFSPPLPEAEFLRYQEADEARESPLATRADAPTN